MVDFSYKWFECFALSELNLFPFLVLCDQPIAFAKYCCCGDDPSERVEAFQPRLA